MNCLVGRERLLMLVVARLPLLLLALSVTLQAQIAFAQGPLYVVRRDKAYGFAESNGRIVIAPQFDLARHFSEDRAPVEAKGRWGYIDRTGKFIIDPQFADADPFAEGLAAVQSAENVKRGYIGLTGRMIIPPQFERSKAFAESLAAVRIDNRWGFIDRTGKVVVSPKYDLAESFSGGLAAVKQGTKWGYIDRNANFVIPPTFDDAKGFSEGTAPVRFGDLQNPKFLLIDKSGKATAEAAYRWVGGFSEYLAPVLKGDKWGYIDIRGQEVIKPQFAGATGFLNGLAEVTDPVFGRAIYIDRTGTRRFVKAETPESGYFGGRAPVPVELRSKPTGATVYMIPFFEWDTDPLLRNDRARLKYYQVPDGVTDVTTNVFEQVYIVLFELGGKRDFVRADVLKTKQNRAFIEFK